MHLENFPPTTGFEPGTSRTPGEDSNPLPQGFCIYVDDICVLRGQNHLTCIEIWVN